MKIARQPLVGICISAMLGVALSFILSACSWLLSAFSFLVLWWHVRRTAWILLAYLCAFGCLHRLQTVESQAALFADRMPVDRLWHAQGKIIQVFRPVRAKTSMIIQIEALHSGTKIYRTRIPVLLHYRGPVPKVGMIVKWAGHMKKIENFHFLKSGIFRRFDRRAWLESLGVYLEVYKVGSLHIVSRPFSEDVQQKLAVIRQRIQQAIVRGIEEHKLEAALIQAVTLGITYETETKLIEMFRETGTYHLFSVSGLHVGMIAAIAIQVFRLCKISQVIAVPAIGLLLFFYAGVTGFRPPACRAAFMATIFLGGTYIMRRAFVLNSLAVTALCMLIWNSNFLFRSGFQLSFFVVVAIVLLAPPLYKILKSFMTVDAFLPRKLLTPPQRFFERLGTGMAATIAVSTAAWVGSAPLLIGHFQSISLSALCVNPLVVPLAFLVVSLAMASLLSDLLLGIWLTPVFTHLNLILASIILTLVRWFSMIPFGFFHFS